MKIITPNTNISPGSIDETFIKDSAVTLPKMSTQMVGAIPRPVPEPGTDPVPATEILNAGWGFANCRILTVGTTDFTQIGAPDNNIGTIFRATGAGTGTGTVEKIVYIATQVIQPVVPIDRPVEVDEIPSEFTYGQVNEFMIEDDAITEAKIADGSITAAKIADGTVVEAELADDAVTTDKIIDDAVTTDKILDANVTTAKIADDAVTLAKISTSGASDNQILVYDHSSTSIVWETPSVHYTDAEAITAVQGEATLDLTGKTSISNSAGLLTPILHLVTDNSGTDKTHILLEDSNDDTVAILGRNDTTYNRYQHLLIMDPNHTVPRTNVTGTGETKAGDYSFDFTKYYDDTDEMTMQLNVYGANGGFHIVARDDYNGGVDSYNYKPILLRGSDVSIKIGSTPWGSTTEKLAFNDYGTSVCNGNLVHGLDRETSNHQLEYTGTCTAGTPGVPSVEWFMHRRDAQNRVMEILEATDYGSGDAAVVEIGKQLTVNPVKVASAVPVELANLSSAPGSPTAGMMYFDTSTTPGKFYGYNGSAWVLLDTQ